jgi:aryl-alcohol dehydrogenase-like predicted oxidoreductase
MAGRRLPAVTLGRGGPAVSAIGLGCMVLTGTYAPPSADEAAATFRMAVDSGVTLFDTADIYSDGANEELVGRLAAPYRAHIRLASKFGLVRTGAGLAVDARPDRARRCCEDSLRRLRTDVLDVYYLHRVDPGVPVEETVGAMARLVEAGLVRHLGLCQVTARQLRAAAAAAPITVLQSEWSLWARTVERECLPAARALGIGVVAYGPLGRGFLAGAISAATRFAGSDVRSADRRLHGENLARNLARLRTIREVADRYGATLAQVALAWLRHQGDDVVAIPGVERRDYLEENLGSASLELGRGDLEFLDAAFDTTPGAVSDDAMASSWKS